MKFVIDENIPYIKGVFEPYGDVLYLRGSAITSETVRDATALIVRTRTRCDAALLEHSTVSCLATATIGFDHIDTDYCDERGILWNNASGCNADSVRQYMASALSALCKRKGLSLKGKTIGVVGVGHIGSRVAELAGLLGMRVLLNDPPRARKEGPTGFCSLEAVMHQANIITLHVPFVSEGEDATFHLVDEAFVRGLSRKPILINTCRGEVMATQTVLEARRKGVLSGLVLDCWEHEPRINLELLDAADIATPHIAGYSRDGKAQAATMAVRFISQALHLGLDEWKVTPTEKPEKPTIMLDGKGLSDEALVVEAVLATYDILQDDSALRRYPEHFERLREAYPVRREFPAFEITASNISAKARLMLCDLGFAVR